MPRPADPARSARLDLEVLEIDPAPTFVIKVGTTPLAFDLLYANEAFRNGGYREAVLEGNKTALLFRSWAQAVGELTKPLHEFAGRTWTAELSKGGAALKVVKTVGVVLEEQELERFHGVGQRKDANSDPLEPSRSPVHKRSREDFMEESKHHAKTLFQNVPLTNLNARWEGIQTMMEMSDVGVFEYNTEGKLIHANEAWYRLRYVCVS
jgi:hypothetical protein